MEYYSAIKNNDIIRLIGKGMELEKVILSEVPQTQKDKHVFTYKWTVTVE